MSGAPTANAAGSIVIRQRLWSWSWAMPWSMIGSVGSTNPANPETRRYRWVAASRVSNPLNLALRQRGGPGEFVGCPRDLDSETDHADRPDAEPAAGQVDAHDAAE